MNEWMKWINQMNENFGGCENKIWKQPQYINDVHRVKAKLEKYNLKQT